MYNSIQQGHTLSVVEISAQLIKKGTVFVDNNPDGVILAPEGIDAYGHCFNFDELEKNIDDNDTVTKDVIVFDASSVSNNGYDSFQEHVENIGIHDTMEHAKDDFIKIAEEYLKYDGKWEYEHITFLTIWKTTYWQDWTDCGYENDSELEFICELKDSHLSNIITCQN